MASVLYPNNNEPYILPAPSLPPTQKKHLLQSQIMDLVALLLFVLMCLYFVSLFFWYIYSVLIYS